MEPFFQTGLGRMLCADSLTVLPTIPGASVALAVTSPPFALLVKKEYGNADPDEWLDWFRPFARELQRVLAPDGSLVVDVGGGWNRGVPTRSLCHIELPVMLCKEMGFHLAQEFFWWSPSRLPTSAWTCRKRLRAKDAVNCVWWLSPTPWPKADNRKVLTPYGKAMRGYIRQGKRKPSRSPSGHAIWKNFCRDHGGAIPSNLIALPGRESNPRYFARCRALGVKPHPARFPVELPEFFIRMCTDRGDMVLDPFAGSCATAEAAERLGRRWLAVEQREDYLRGGATRFEDLQPRKPRPAKSYMIWRPDCLWRDGSKGDD